jgi:hypothetical protein
MDKRFTLFRIFRREANAVANSKAQTIKAVCDSLLAGDAQAAAATARSAYPFAPPQSTGRACTEAECTRIFIRDGFIDRYSGTQLVFPGTLRLLSRLLPSEFPFHPNWKMTETHMAYWELFPTVDHIVPIARGGPDDETNWATTSMLRNSAKSNWTLEELGWQLVPAGELQEWNGLLTWFAEFLKRNQSHLADKYIRRWHRTALERMNAAQPVIPADPATGALRLPLVGR